MRTTTHSSSRFHILAFTGSLLLAFRVFFVGTCHFSAASAGIMSFIDGSHFRAGGESIKTNVALQPTPSLHPPLSNASCPPVLAQWRGTLFAYPFPACYRWELQPQIAILDAVLVCTMNGQAGGGVEVKFLKETANRGPIANPVVLPPM